MYHFVAMAAKNCFVDQVVSAHRHWHIFICPESYLWHVKPCLYAYIFLNK